MFVNSLHYSAEVLDRYALHAFAVMPTTYTYS